MLKAAACLLAFVCLMSGGTGIETQSVRASFEFDPSAISYDAVLAESGHVGLGIGRHTMVQILDYEFLGEDSVEALTEFHNGSVTENVHFEETVETYNSAVFSTTEEFSFDVTLSLSMQLGVGVSAEVGTSVTAGYVINSTSTYTVAERVSYTLEYDIPAEYIDNKEYAIGIVGDIYKIEWQTWQWDDWWWGDFEVEGSRKKCIGYLVANQYVTVVYRDGSYVSIDG